MRGPLLAVARTPPSPRPRPRSPRPFELTRPGTAVHRRPIRDIRVIFDPGFPPLVSSCPQGPSAWLSADLLRAALKDTGLSIAPRPARTGRNCSTRPQERRRDMAAKIVYAPERAPVPSFSPGPHHLHPRSIHRRRENTTPSEALPTLPDVARPWCAATTASASSGKTARPGSTSSWWTPPGQAFGMSPSARPRPSWAIRAWPRT